MSEPALPREGGCRCGRVRFRIDAPPMLSMACHCTGCQKMTSSAFSLSVLVPAEAFQVTAGEPVIGGLHGETRHFFCPHCMSWMFTRFEPPPLVNVRATLLDDTRDVVPFMETYTCEKLAWVTTPAVHSFEKFPEPSDYDDLIAAYGARELRS